MKMTLVRLAIIIALAFAAALAQAQTCTTPEATIISPTPGTVLPTGAVTFNWCNAGADYFVRLETLQGAGDIIFGLFHVTSLQVGPQCATTVPIQCIPANGETLFFTLETVSGKQLIGAHQYIYTAPGSVGSAGVWKGGAGVWSNALNWTGGVPNGAFNVFIDKGNALASSVTLDMNASIDSLSIDADDKLTIKDATALTVNGPTISNLGNIFIASAGNPTALNIGAGKSVSLGGAGKITLSETIDNGAASISGGSGSSLTNVGNTIQGAGQVGHGSGLALVNQAKGIISASANFGLNVNALGGVSNAGAMKAMSGRTLTLASPVTNSGTISTVGAGSKVLVNSSLSNPGKLVVGGGGLINITGPFSNFSGTTSTLTGGTYLLTGTLQFQNASILKNAAAITLTGAASKIVNQTAVGALKNLNSNLATGSFTLQAGRLFTTPAAFTNAGILAVGVGSGFGTTSSYTQTAGRTTVDGALSAPGGMHINAGSLFGKGTIQSTVTSGGSVTPGDSALTAGQLSISGTYSQTATGILNIAIGGLTVGTQYDRLAVTNGVSLNGKLALKRINAFVPAIGSSFTIMTGSAVTGKFTTVTGLGINSGEHFQVNYGPTSVTVTVVSGP